MAMGAKASILPHIHMGGEGGGGCEEGGVGGGDVAVMERLSATTEVEEGGEGGWGCAVVE